jgi:PAS domain S-box-containing protein
MNRTLRAVVRSGFWLVPVVLAADAVLVYSGLRTIARTNSQVDHTRRVIVALERALSSLKDAETGQRGYLLTGQENYLEPFQAAEAELGRSLDHLRALTSDNDGQAARADELRRLAAKKLAELRQTIALRRGGNPEAALEVVRTDEGKRVMDQARRVAAAMEAEEDRLLDERLAAARSAVRNTVASFTLTTAAALLLLTGVSYMDRRGAAIRERAAEAIRQERAWLSTTLTSIGDAVIATDGVGRVRFMNPLAEALTGWAQPDATGRPMVDVFRIINEQTRRPAEDPVARVIREGVVVGLANHTTLVARDGTETPVEDSAAPIKGDRGEILGVVLVFRDAGERRRHAEALRRSKEEAEQANRAKDQFLAVLSHELRTPLNPILLATTAMLERPPSADEVRQNLEMIRQNVELQARLIDDLLDVMRIARGKMPLHWEVADAHAMILRAVEICRSEVLGMELRLGLELAAAHHHINADPARLQQVFWNLLKNAIKFTPSGGVVTVRTRNEPDVEPGGHRLVIEVSDTGIGIEPEVLAKVFDPFQQGETSITRKFGGMGLGLAISRGIVEGHGGLLTVESDGKDRGATFRIELKSLPDPKPVGGARRGDAGAAGGPQAQAPLSILVVEDESATLRLLAKLLMRLGHRVVAADTISSALEALDTKDLDLIISDVGLPDGSGLELMRQVVARRGPTPAVALTGYGTEEDIQRSREAGFTAHMTKPIDFTKLEAMILQVTAGTVAAD